MHLTVPQVGIMSMDRFVELWWRNIAKFLGTVSRVGISPNKQVADIEVIVSDDRNARQTLRFRIVRQGAMGDIVEVDIELETSFYASNITEADGAPADAVAERKATLDNFIQAVTMNRQFSSSMRMDNDDE
jgi:hypothetical protein